jgi:hypothetical protein
MIFGPQIRLNTFAMGRSFTVNIFSGDIGTDKGNGLNIRMPTNFPPRRFLPPWVVLLGGKEGIANLMSSSSLA